MNQTSPIPDRRNKLRLLAALPFFSLSAFSQSSLPNPAPTFVPLGASSYRFDWTGAAGITYFFQYSQDLENWAYCPIIEHGIVHDPIDPCVLDTNNNPLLKYFMRMVYTDIPTTNPQGDDFDGDGISNIAEVKFLDTNPLAFTLWADSDSDRLPDAWEIANWGNLAAQSGAGDADSDSLTNVDEFSMGSDPKNDQTAPAHATTIRYDSAGRLTDTNENSWSYDAEGNVETAR